jgi:putative endonuclease
LLPDIWAAKNQKGGSIILKGYMYILECSDGSYYTGSTINLELRIQQHQRGEGANYTKKHLPVKLIYYEEFQRIDEAFYREKQIQGWSRSKKNALINGKVSSLNKLAGCKNDTHFRASTMLDSTTLSHPKASKPQEE